MALIELAQQFKRIEEEILVSRIEWERKTKPFLVQHLNKIKADIDLNIEITIDRSILNLESIVFMFKDSYCGLTYDPCNDLNISKGFSGDIKKRGAVLNFAQRYNGQVIIWMAYPHILFLDRPLEKKSELLTTVAQNKIDDEVVNRFLQDFLSKVNTWHRREYKPMLGVEPFDLI
jgi:hypothetical protein